MVIQNMILTKKTYKFILAGLSMAFLPSCTDEFNPVSDEEIVQIEEEEDFSDVPEEIRNGFSISFKMDVAPMSRAGDDTSTSGDGLREIERFVDLEKLRILFFTCLDDKDLYMINESGAKIDYDPSKKGTSTTYETGQHDIFLFEAKSRWVSRLSTAEASDATYRVTTPVFTYGNNADYNWNDIRRILCERPFKIVILANRPELIRAADFDDQYQKDQNNGNIEFTFHNTGPYWDIEESNQAINDFKTARDNVFQDLGKSLKGKQINELHHCQWDPVYGNKNTGTANRVYDFIMKNPQPTKPDLANREVEVWKKNEPDAMGAVSAWTKWLTHEEWYEKTKDSETFAGFTGNGNWITSNGKPLNFYFLPNTDQGIPMYGVQRFEALGDWKEGTPFSLSPKNDGTTSNSNYDRKIIRLLRSVARIDLFIPKKLGNGNSNVIAPSLEYSNVYARCEPIDVATPTDRLMKEIHDEDCEWWDIYRYGPIIVDGLTANVATFIERNAWFYGTWQYWGWNFNPDKTGIQNIDFTKHGKNMPFPHIYNPCIQRNGTARLDFVKVDDPYYHHYVVYTGERNINDPSKFDNFNVANSELAYFKFSINIDGRNETTYCLALNPYNNNTTKGFLVGGTSDMKNFKTTNATNGNCNYPIMRNHHYSFYVTRAAGGSDENGIGALVIAAEERNANIWYY